MAEFVLPPPRRQTLIAFAIIYLVWGSTFLAIRIGVRDLPPFLFAGMRFLVAGAALCGWMRAKGTPSPTARQWASASVMAVMIFVLDYGLLFWAEQRVPSGIAAVMSATIPVFMALAEIILLRTQKLTPRLGLILLMGMAGVAVLVSHSATLGGSVIDPSGAVALLVGCISWSLAASLSRKLALPESKVMSSGTQMLAGGILLTLTAGMLGEFQRFHPRTVSASAWIALVYLIVFGSIVAYTAYVWLLHHESPTKVGTYAFVNPIVAVLLGYMFAKEPLGSRTIAGMALILVSVVVITTTPKNNPKAGPAIGETELAD